MTIGTNEKDEKDEKPKEWREKTKGVMKLDTSGCLHDGVLSLCRLA